MTPGMSIVAYLIAGVTIPLAGTTLKLDDDDDTEGNLDQPTAVMMMLYFTLVGNLSGRVCLSLPSAR